MIRHVRNFLNDNWRVSWGWRPAGADAIYADYRAFAKLVPDLIRDLRLDPLEKLPHVDFRESIEIALPRIEAARKSGA